MSTADTNFSPSPGSAMADAAPVSSVIQRESLMKTLVTLIRREFWEHPGLWRAPVVIAVLLVACAFPAHIDFVRVGSTSAFNGDAGREALFGLMQWGLTLPQYLVMVIVLSFYLLDCLYGERKDRSILFWKSLPVSDGATVASKLLVALVVVPLGVYLLAIVTNLLFSAIWIARASMGHASGIAFYWSTVTFLKVETLMLLSLIVSILWYAPLAAALLLISAWARRAVLLWATLPPVVAVVIERVAFGTHYVANLFNYRVTGIWRNSHLESAIRDAVVIGGHEHIVSLTRVFDNVNVSELFLNVDLWLGVAVTAGFAFAAARIRRYRDDT
jgi:ABC-2 type transport system permease protein